MMEEEIKREVKLEEYDRRKLVRVCSGYGVDMEMLWRDMERLAGETIAFKGYHETGAGMWYPYELQISLFAAKIDRGNEMLDFVEDPLRKRCHCRVDVLVFKNLEERDEYLRIGKFINFDK